MFEVIVKGGLKVEVAATDTGLTFYWLSGHAVSPKVVAQIDTDSVWEQVTQQRNADRDGYGERWGE